MRKKKLIEYIETIRPKADAYDRVCLALGIENDILGYIQKMKENAIKSSNEHNIFEVITFWIDKTKQSIEDQCNHNSSGEYLHAQLVGRLNALQDFLDLINKDRYGK